LPHYPAVSIIAGSESDALTKSEKGKEAQRVAEARKAAEVRRAAEAQKAEARKNSKKQAMLARARRYNAFAYGYADQFSGGARLFSYAPVLNTTDNASSELKRIFPNRLTLIAAIAARARCGQRATRVAKRQRSRRLGSLSRGIAWRQLLLRQCRCRIMCDVGHTCGEDTTRNNDFFIACREPAADASHLGRDLARILLCDATTVVVMFSSLVARLGGVGISEMEEFHRYPLRVQQSKLDGWWFIFVDEVGLGILGPNFEDLLDRLKVLAGNLFRARGETVADVEIVRSEKPALHVFHWTP
jgi:hypothetical protein